MNRYLGLDLGTKTLGISISDKSNILSMPLITIRFKENNPSETLDELKRIIEEKKITELVLGLPKKYG